MATIQEIIRRVDMSKPNAFGDKIKMRWLALLDGKIAMNVLLLDAAEAVHVEYTREEDLAKEPLVSFPYDDIYDLWLSAQIDFYNGEYDRYQNSMEMFNAHYMDYVKYVADNFDPVQQGGGCRRGDNRFYLTAYGLAVKHGFAGTEEEWLVSLVGQAPVFQIGEVTTVPYVTPAAVTIRGTPHNPILDFAIPRGFSEEDAAGYCEQAAKSAEEAQKQAAAANEALDQVALKIYPVGAIYMSLNDADPSVLFGGKWEQVHGKFLLGAGDEYAAGDTGGEATHALTVAELPAHSHATYLIDNADLRGGEGSNTAYAGEDWAQGTINTQETGSNTAHNNMPPFLAVYMWKRTA